MGKNHLETSRKGRDVKRGSPIHTGSGLRLQHGCGSLPLREARCTDRTLKHRGPVLGSADHVESSSERPRIFCLLEKD